MILIADSIPNFLASYIENIILFKPIEGINTIFIAQVIRILYPCLYNNQNILITDTDIFPISKKYFIDSIENIPDDRFVSYRHKYLKQKMLSICYNVANSETWRDIFGIKTMDDITRLIKEWYIPSYTGKKNCPGWFTDQQKLYQYVMKWKDNHVDRLIILEDKNLHFNRLDKRQRKYIIMNFNKIRENIKNGIYTDFHCIKPFSYYERLIKLIIIEIYATKTN